MTGSSKKPPIWKGADFLAAAEGDLVGEMEGDVFSISIDSRTVKEGAAFFAIKGENFDGHDFAAASLAAGASVAVVGKGFDVNSEPKNQGAFLVVDDPLAAMERVGIAARARSSARVCGITGSVGKTSSKEALARVLGASGAVHASPSSFNNHWGVPYSLAGFAAENDFGVFEMGMNHPKEIEPLTKMVRPHVALITTVAPVHIGYFSSVDEIAEAKAEIFCGLEPGGVAVLLADNPYFEFLSERARSYGASVISFGEAQNADVRLLSFSSGPSGSEIEADVCGNQVRYRLGAPGKHLAINSLGVLGAAHGLGADIAAGAEALGEMAAPVGRGERTVLNLGQPGEKEETALLIDESYNANPVSMAAALEMLGSAQPGPGGRRIAVLGDMLELGAESARYHLELAENIAGAQVDLALLSGPFMAELGQKLSKSIKVVMAPTAAENQPRLLEEVHAGDVIMVKGSLGSRLGPLVAALKRRYAAPASSVKDQ